MGNKRIITAFIISVATLATAAAVIASLFYFGVFHINDPSRDKYPVRGVDVSRYQGEIDWKTLSGEDISFAFIKATEGSSHVDPKFEYNWAEAGKTDLRIGAYHFFSFETSGDDQADNFISAVEPKEGMLPPVVDVEFYGKFSKVNTNVDAAAAKLRVLVDRLTEHYGMKPILYVSDETLATIVGSDFEDCDIWYRSVYGAADEDVSWTFWQFSNRFRLNGYDGEEKYIDMNVFCGTAEEFASYPAGR